MQSSNFSITNITKEQLSLEFNDVYKVAVQFYPLGKIFKPCIFLLFALSLKQRKIIFKPGITLNQNINLYNETLVKEKVK